MIEQIIKDRCERIVEEARVGAPWTQDGILMQAKMKEHTQQTAEAVLSAGVKDFVKKMIEDLNKNTPNELKELNDAFAEGVLNYSQEYLTQLQTNQE
jgi:hypothetical protein